MKEQAILREEMNYLFKIGNVEVSIKQRIDSFPGYNLEFLVTYRLLKC